MKLRLKDVKNGRKNSNPASLGRGNIRCFDAGRILSFFCRPWSSLGIVLFLATPLRASNWYVDASAIGSHNGISWSTAWTNLLQVSGVSAGDTIYISGGPAGSSQTYNQKEWDPAFSGSPGNPIVFKNGTDSTHNGNVIFDGGGTEQFFFGSHGNFPAHWITIDGTEGTTNQFITIQRYSNEAFYADNCTNTTLQGIKFIGNSYRNNSGANITFAYDYFNITNVANTCAICSGIGSIVHHCTFILARDPVNGCGDCGVQWPGYGSIIFSNTFIGNVMTNYPGGKHQDGIQAWASHIQIFDNTFYNLGTSATFIAPAGSSTPPITNVWVYNNTVEHCWEGLAYGDNNAGTVVTNWGMIFANNTVSDCAEFNMGNVSGTGTNYSFNSIAANNLVVNSGNGIVIAPENIITNGNVIVTAVNASNYFKAYTKVDGSVGFTTATYDFHLMAAATPLIGTGTNLTFYFNTDHDNNTRPVSGAWTRGAYQGTNAAAINVWPPGYLHVGS